MAWVVRPWGPLQHEAGPEWPKGTLVTEPALRVREPASPTTELATCPLRATPVAATGPSAPSCSQNTRAYEGDATVSRRPPTGGRIARGKNGAEVHVSCLGLLSTGDLGRQSLLPAGGDSTQRRLCLHSALTLLCAKTPGRQPCGGQGLSAPSGRRRRSRSPPPRAVRAASMSAGVRSTCLARLTSSQGHRFLLSDPVSFISPFSCHLPCTHRSPGLWDHDANTILFTTPCLF